MKTINLNLYSFAELSPEAQQHAIEKEKTYQYENGEPLLFFEDYAQEKASEKGFKDCSFQWSISYSQGDGLSFTCKDFDLITFLQGLKFRPSLIKVICENTTLKITGNQGHYQYASKNDVELYLDRYNGNDAPNVEAKIAEAEEALQDLYMGLCKELESDAYAQYEYATGDEAARDNLEANDAEELFTEDGNRY